MLLPTLLPRLGVGAHGVAWAAASGVDAIVLGVALARATHVSIVRALGPSSLCAFASGALAYTLVAAAQPTVLLGVGAAAGSTLLYAALALAVARPAVVDLWGVGRHVLRAGRR